MEHLFSKTKPGQCLWKFERWVGYGKILNLTTRGSWSRWFLEEIMKSEIYAHSETHSPSAGNLPEMYFGFEIALQGKRTCKAIVLVCVCVCVCVWVCSSARRKLFLGGMFTHKHFLRLLVSFSQGFQKILVSFSYVSRKFVTFFWHLLLPTIIYPQLVSPTRLRSCHSGIRIIPESYRNLGAQKGMGMKLGSF